MSIFDRIRQIFSQARAAETGATTLTEAPPRREDPVDWARRFAAETERVAIITTCREMYRTDPRARRMLRVLARDMTKGGFAVEVDSPRAAEVAQGLYERLDLDSRLDDWVRLTARDGDTFLELVVNERLEIVAASRKPTLQVHRASNAADGFDDPERAFWLAPQAHGQIEPPADAIWFPAWAIVHARWEHDEGSRYGVPLLASGTGAWKRVREGELDVAVRRKTRSGIRYLHVVEGGTEADLESYKERNRAALAAAAAQADFFTNRPGSISVLQGDAHLNEIADVRHHIATWFQAGEVPMELLGYGEDLNRDVLGEKRAEYEETLEQLRAWVVAELIKPLLERQWLLAGIWPGSLDWDVHWKTKAAITPADVAAVAEAALRLRALGVREEVIWGVLARFLPGVDSAMMASSIAAEGDEVDRIAAVLASLRPGSGAGGGHG